jgi:hypothetical protein
MTPASLTLCPGSSSCPCATVARAEAISVTKGPTGKIVKREIVLPDDLGL